MGVPAGEAAREREGADHDLLAIGRCVRRRNDGGTHCEKTLGRGVAETQSPSPNPPSPKPVIQSVFPDRYRYYRLRAHASHDGALQRRPLDAAGSRGVETGNQRRPVRRDAAIMRLGVLAGSRGDHDAVSLSSSPPERSPARRRRRGPSAKCSPCTSCWTHRRGGVRPDRAGRRADAQGPGRPGLAGR